VHLEDGGALDRLRSRLEVPTPGWDSGLRHLAEISQALAGEGKRRASGSLFPNAYVDLGEPAASERLLSEGSGGDAPSAPAATHCLRKRRRCDYFNMQNQLVALIMRLSLTLTSFSEKSERIACLRSSVGMLNRWLLDRRVFMTFDRSAQLGLLGLHVPVQGGRDSRQQILHLHIDQCRIFTSATRAPFLLVYETANLDERVEHRPPLEILAACVSCELTAAGISEDSEFPADAASDFPQRALWSRISGVTAKQWRRMPGEAPRVQVAKSPGQGIQASREEGESAKGDPQVAKLPEGEIQPICTEAACAEGDVPAAASAAAAAASAEVAEAEVAEAEAETAAPEAAAPEATEADAAPRDSGTASESETRRVRKSGSKRKEVAKKTRLAIWGEPWKEKEERIRRESLYGGYSSWALNAIMVKGGDDVRQEVLASQIIEQFSAIFREAKLPLWLKATKVVVTGAQSGFIEYIRDSTSVDALKKHFPGKTLAEIFKVAFADNLFQTKQNFIESYAAYSLIVWFLQVKDRHNGNLMMTSSGHVIHIDYGFMLSNSPGGNMAFEQSPFKLTQEFLDVMDGERSEQFAYFRRLVVRGFLEARKHMERITLPIQMMLRGSKLPCFREGEEAVMRDLHDRFFVNLTEEACVERIVELIESSVNNWRTIQYDNFQRIVNGIL